MYYTRTFRIYLRTYLLLYTLSGLRNSIVVRLLYTFQIRTTRSRLKCSAWRKSAYKYARARFSPLSAAPFSALAEEIGGPERSLNRAPPPPPDDVETAATPEKMRYRLKIIILNHMCAAAASSLLRVASRRPRAVASARGCCGGGRRPRRESTHASRIINTHCYYSYYTRT